MKMINIPSMSVLLDRTKRIKSIQELYGYAKSLMTSNEENRKQSEEAAQKANETAAALQSAIEAKDAELKAANTEIYSMKQAIGNLGGAVTYSFPDTTLGKGFSVLMGNNGTVKLSEDVTTGRYGPGVIASNKTTLDLNGHNITFTNAGNYGGIMARGTQQITIKGKGVLDARDGIAVECNSASAVINLAGSTTTYQTNRPNAELIYCYAGTINISGGTFKNGGSKYLLNCYDANYKSGKAKISVTGGKFYDFNPGDNLAEGPSTSYLAEGYTVVTSTVTEEDGEHTVYTVKKM